MATVVKPTAPIIHPIADPRGVVTRPWALFFQRSLDVLEAEETATGDSLPPVTPGGPETAIQSHQGGAFYGDSGLRYDPATQRVSMEGQYFTAATYLVAGATVSVNWNEGNECLITLSAPTATIAFVNPTDGGRYAVLVRQDATGGRTVTWPTNVVWPRGTPPTLTTTPGYLDLTTFMYLARLDRYIGAFNLQYNVT
jgi:hypothetical protein